jgi:hypothetical protein
MQRAAEEILVMLNGDLVNEGYDEGNNYRNVAIKELK